MEETSVLSSGLAVSANCKDEDHLDQRIPTMTVRADICIQQIRYQRRREPPTRPLRMC